MSRKYSNYHKLIRGFDIENFFCTCSSYDDSNDYGGVIVVTPKQFVLGMNFDNGLAFHKESFACVYSFVKGGTPSYVDIDKLSKSCFNSFICARIYYFCGNAYIQFYFPKKINEELYNSFSCFCDSYRGIIDELFNFSEFNFHLGYNDSDIYNECSSLDDVLDFIKVNSIDNESFDEVIIGTSTSDNKVLKK